MNRNPTLMTPAHRERWLGVLDGLDDLIARQTAALDSGVLVSASDDLTFRAPADLDGVPADLRHRLGEALADTQRLAERTRDLAAELNSSVASSRPRPRRRPTATRIDRRV